MPTPTQEFIFTVLTGLQSRMPALVSAQGLPAITEYLDYRPALPQLDKAPQVFVDMAVSTRDLQMKHGATLAKYSEARSFLVIVTTAGTDPQAASRQLRAYVDLVRLAVEQDKQAGGASWVAWQSTEWSPNFGSATRLYQEAVLTFSAPRQAVYGST